jgi:hypothetical protein
MTEASDDAVVKSDKGETSLSDALEKLSLTTELDAALLKHLNLLDEYMFHVECLSQQFRMVLNPPPPFSGPVSLNPRSGVL